MNNETYENMRPWTSATTDIFRALADMMSCIHYGYNARLVADDNVNLKQPIMKKNPLLDDPYNWEFNYGTIVSDGELDSHKWFNETEKDLSHNWVHAYGSPKAIELYRETGEITKDLCLSVGVSHHLPRTVAQEHRDTFIKDGYDYYKTRLFTDFYRPKKGIPFYVVDEDIGKAFGVYFNEEPADKAELARNAAQIFEEYATMLDKAEKA